MKKFLLAILASFLISGLAFATINLNTANEKELISVNGIGPATAKAIIDYRSKNGPFKSVEDLQKIKGIGKKRLEHLRPQVAVSGPNVPEAISKKPRRGHAGARHGATGAPAASTTTVPNPMAPAAH